MPAAGSLLVPSVKGLARAAAGFSHSNMADFIHANDFWISDDNEVNWAPKDSPVTPTYAADDVVVAEDVSSNPDAIGGISFKDVGGNIRVTFVYGDRNVVTASQTAAMIETANHANAEPEGRSLMQATGPAARSLATEAHNDGNYSGGTDVSRETERRLHHEPFNPNHGPAIENALRSKGKHDRARTSMEYHEWKFNLVDTGKNWELVHNGIVTPTGIDYIGPGPVAPNDSPPWYKWIEHENLRKIMNLVKKYRRIRSACGGKALWQEQGFATKELAITDDVNNDSNYATWASALKATADFQNN